MRALGLARLIAANRRSMMVDALLRGMFVAVHSRLFGFTPEVTRKIGNDLVKRGIARWDGPRLVLRSAPPTPRLTLVVKE